VTAIITDRQYTAARLYYCEGWTYRKIGQALNCCTSTAFNEVRTVQTFCVGLAEDGMNVPPIVEAFTNAAGGNTGAKRDAGAALARQAALSDELASRLECREDELLALAECMSGDCYLPSHVKKNPYDQWELHLLNSRGRTSLGSGDYEASSRYMQAKATRAQRP
jgi:hypothetical protein